MLKSKGGSKGKAKKGQGGPPVLAGSEQGEADEKRGMSLFAQRAWPCLCVGRSPDLSLRNKDCLLG